MNKENKQDKVFEINNKALEKKKEKNDKIYREAILKLNECIEDLIQKHPEIEEKEKEARKDFFNEKNEDNFVANRFFASYFSYDYAIGKDTTPAIMALNNYKFGNTDRRVIYNCIKSYTSLFVIDKIHGKEVVIKDLFTQKLYNTLDAKILGDFNVGDFIIARPVLIEDTYCLIDLTIRIQKETKDLIYDNLVQAYKKSYGYDDIKSDIEYFVALNSLYFYLYMIQLLEMSNYGTAEKSEEISDSKAESKVEEVESISSDEKSKEDTSSKAEDSKDEEVLSNEDDVVISLIKENIGDNAMFDAVVSLWNQVSSNLKITGAENGWAAGLEYNYRKSIGDSSTQNDIAKKYGVSTSTLAKRNKEIASAM